MEPSNSCALLATKSIPFSVLLLPYYYSPTPCSPLIGFLIHLIIHLTHLRALLHNNQSVPATPTFDMLLPVFNNTFLQSFCYECTLYPPICHLPALIAIAFENLRVPHFCSFPHPPSTLLQSFYYSTQHKPKGHLHNKFRL